MRWLGLTYSLPSGSSSSPRVAIWRRLRHLGAASPTGSLYFLPFAEENQEAFEWLAQEIQEAGGEALVLPIDRLDGKAEERLIELFRGARAEEYSKIVAEADEARREDRSEQRDHLEKLRRRFAEVARIDFFQAPEGAEAAAALAKLEGGLGRSDSTAREVPAADLARYRGRRWVTRPGRTWTASPPPGSSAASSIRKPRSATARPRNRTRSPSTCPTPSSATREITAPSKP
ncbi:MAG TPA: Chromate resistance protein ChrB [Thermoanaerobaculia bacterium]|nr:Chromate resistance protein ChrB [Thermoanaerobaculia bacterium]